MRACGARGARAFPVRGTNPSGCRPRPADGSGFLARPLQCVPSLFPRRVPAPRVVPLVPCVIPRVPCVLPLLPCVVPRVPCVVPRVPCVLPLSPCVVPRVPCVLPLAPRVTPLPLGAALHRALLRLLRPCAPRTSLPVPRADHRIGPRHVPLRSYLGHGPQLGHKSLQGDPPTGPSHSAYPPGLRYRA